MTTDEAQHAASESAPTLFTTDASGTHLQPGGIQRQQANDASASNADGITEAEPSVVELSTVLLIVLAGMATTFALGAIILLIAIHG